MTTSKVRPFLNHFNEGDAVLDGCGFGIEFNAVSTRVEYSKGLNIDSANLRAARHFLGDKAQKIDFVMADIRYLPFKACHFPSYFVSCFRPYLIFPRKSARFTVLFRYQ
jgi:ubiquinone/menaquinone biosynthesis C-methylase UbiE